jgi:beta-mannosidase
MMSEKILGEGRTSEERILKIGYVQYEWVRLLVESHRRNQWYSSGIIFWMYNDIWAASGWALIDHYGYPKAGYYGMKKAANPILVSIEETQHGWDVYVVNDTADTISGSLKMFLEPFNANHPRVDLSTVPFDVSTNCSAKVFALAKSKVNGIFDNRSMLVAEIFGEFGKQRTCCPSGMPKDMVLENVTLNVERVGNENGFLKISTDHYARIVCLEGDFDFEDNYFDILPRSSVEIRFSKAEGPMDRNMKGLIRVYALNGSGPNVIELSSR